MITNTWRRPASFDNTSSSDSVASFVSLSSSASDTDSFESPGSNSSSLVSTEGSCWANLTFVLRDLALYPGWICIDVAGAAGGGDYGDDVGDGGGNSGGGGCDTYYW